MLITVDGIVIATEDPTGAARTLTELFGAERDEPFPSQVLTAELTPMFVGASRILLARPTGEGATSAFCDRWSEGILAAVVSTTQPRALLDRLDERRVPTTHSDELLFVDPSTTFDLRTIVVPHMDRPAVGGLEHLYEVTHLVGDWERAAAAWADVFGLDEGRFCPISSEEYGYEGTLALFDPPDRLDRIEVVHPHDRSKPMGRFFEKRGRSAYMCFAECDDVPALAERLDRSGTRYAVGTERDGAPESLFVHPSSLHGVLLGVSRTGLAWQWSGRPGAAGPG